MHYPSLNKYKELLNELLIPENKLEKFDRYLYGKSNQDKVNKRTINPYFVMKKIKLGFESTLVLLSFAHKEGLIFPIYIISNDNSTVLGEYHNPTNLPETILDIDNNEYLDSESYKVDLYFGFTKDFEGDYSNLAQQINLVS